MSHASICPGFHSAAGTKPSRCSDVPCVNDSGNHSSLGLLLKPIVSNGAGCIQPILDIAVFEDGSFLGNRMRPDAGITIGLNSTRTRDLIRVGCRQAGALRGCLRSSVPIRF